MLESKNENTEFTRDKVWKDIEKIRIEKEKQEKDKRFILWSGVIFFMILISFFWLLSFKKSFARIENSSTTTFNWSEMGDNFKKTTENLKEALGSFEEIKDQQNEQSISEEDVERLKKELENKKIENDLATSTDYLDENVGLPID